MILLVDIGNSRIKCAHLRAGVLVPSAAAVGACALDALAGLVSRSRAVFACSVANPSVAQQMNALCARHCIACTWVDSTYPFPALSHAYLNPAELGNDRWVAMAGARALYTGNLCVVDCGTATTVDYISANGQHRGGIIFAGIQTTRCALKRNTQGLPNADAPVSSFSCSTQEAVASGAVIALSAGIDRVLDAAHAQFSADVRVLIGGGEGERVCAHLRHKAEHVPNLVLRGLALAASAK